MTKPRRWYPFCPAILSSKSVKHSKCQHMNQCVYKLFLLSNNIVMVRVICLTHHFHCN